jgi:uncharacterized damage-inducible protein DinB
MQEPVTLAGIREAMRATQLDLLATLDEANAQALYHRAAEGVWSLADVLAHVANLRRFFIGQALHVAAAPGSSLGRTIQDAERLAAVRDHGRDSAQALREGLLASHTELMAGLEKLSDADLATAGQHVNPKFGRQTLAEFLQHFVVEHEQSHVRQARACLANAGR